MTGAELRELRKSLGLTLAQAVIVLNNWMEPMHIQQMEAGFLSKRFLDDYAQKLRRWQSAGERKDEQ